MQAYLFSSDKIRFIAENFEDRNRLRQLGVTFNHNGDAFVAISCDAVNRLLSGKATFTYYDEKITEAYAVFTRIKEQRQQALKEEQEKKKIAEQQRLQKKQEAANKQHLKKLQAEQERQDFVNQEIPSIRRASGIKYSLKKEPFCFKELDDYNTFLMPHQIAGCELAAIFNKYAFFYDTGTGKTVMALEIMSNIVKKTQAKFLVICPKTIINTAWMSDCERFYPKFKLLPLSKNIKNAQYRRIYKAWNEFEDDYEKLYIDDFEVEKHKPLVINILSKRADALIVNPESFDTGYYLEAGVNGLIVDESSMLKNYSSVITRKVREFAKKMKWVYFLSGKPAPNCFKEYFSQMKIIDDIYLNMSYDFYVNNVNTTRDIAELVERKSITISKTDCFDLPAKMYLIRKVSLDKQSKERYNEMFYAWRLEYIKEQKKNKSISVGNHLSALAKLRQIASGFIIDGKETDKYIHIHDRKINELQIVIDELGDNQAIIWCEFQYEIEKIEKMLSSQGVTVVTAYGKTEDKDQSIRSFKDGTAKFIIAHPRTLMYGVTLTNCTYAIYFSTSYSYEAYYQSHDRIYRLGQENPCTYIFIQAQDTVDEIMYDCIQNKRQQSEFFESLLNSVTL